MESSYSVKITGDDAGRAIVLTQSNADSTTSVKIREADFLEVLLSMNRIGEELGIEPQFGGKSYTLEDKRAEHPKAYTPWTAEEEERLAAFSRDGLSVKEIASKLDRNEGAIKSRKKRLGL